MALLLIVEDRLSFAKDLAATARAAGSGHRVAVMHHREALEERSASTLCRADVILVDCMDRSSQQEDISASQLGCLDVLERITGLGAPGNVCAYSTEMRKGEVNIPVREYPIVRAAFTTSAMRKNVVALLDGASPGDEIPKPTPGDFDRLQVGRHGLVAASHQLMRSRPDAWELVWQAHHPAPSRATRAWIVRRIGPLLDLDPPDVKHIVEVLQRVARLPVR